VFSQNTETFLRFLENAFRHFGSVPKVLNVESLWSFLQNPWFTNFIVRKAPKINT